MRSFLILLLSTGFLLLGPARAQTSPDWARTVTMTADGTYVLGNPNAPTRLVEYISYTCPHCAHFVVEASGPLRSGWVRHGLVSVEVRNAIRDPYDLTAALLARCGGKARFFGDHEAIFLNQSAWMPRIQAYESSRKPLPEGAAPSARLIDIAAGTGLGDFMAKRGLPPARQQKCLADRSSLDLLAAMARDAWETRGIGGTPAFTINGRLLDDVHDWASLRAALPAPPK